MGGPKSAEVVRNGVLDQPSLLAACGVVVLVSMIQYGFRGLTQNTSSTTREFLIINILEEIDSDNRGG